MLTRLEFQFPQEPRVENLTENEKKLLAYTSELKKSVAEVLRTFNRPNTLLIWEWVDWTPTLTFATAGDLSVTYSNRVGKRARVGELEVVYFQIVTSAFTHTTASGAAQITGLVNTSKSTSPNIGTMFWGGITKANYTQVVPRVNTSSATIDLIASGSAQAASSVAAADMPTGGTVNLTGMVAYKV